jgi:toxin-antitoxin system PIN domain toxin
MTRASKSRRNAVRETAAQWSPEGSTYLLDVNVLIALIDPAHSHHPQAHEWFHHVGSNAWVTCALTQNGVLRIIGHARYPEGPKTPAKVVSLLADLCALPGHRFWPCDHSLLDSPMVDSARLLDSSQITYTYLLALAVKHGGKLATFDRRLVADAVRGGKAALHVIA